MVDSVLGRKTETDKDITITDDQRIRSVSVVGGTGTGKTTLLTGVALQFIEHGECVILFAVEPDIINKLLVRIPQERMNDVILLDLSDRRRFLGLNYLEQEEDIERFIELLKRLWNITPETPNLENTLRASLLTLQYNHLTLDRMPDLLRSKEFRASCMARIPETLDAFFVREFWEKDFSLHDVQYQIRNSDSTLNKIMQMFMDKYIGYIVAQTTTTLHLRKDILDKKKILLVHLSKFDLEKERVRRIGAMILDEVKRALFSRADLPEHDRHIVNLLCDEWQMYLTPDFFEDVLSQGRRYGVSTWLATQTLANFDSRLQAILDQVGTHITYAVGREDANKLAAFYALDPQAETRYEHSFILSPAPVDTVLLRKPHTNNVVNELFKPWRELVQTAHRFINEGSIPGSTTTTISRRGVTKINSRPDRSWSNREEVEEAQAGLDKINAFLYQVMLQKTPFVVMPPDLLTWVAEAFELPFFDYERHHQMTVLLEKFDVPQMPVEWLEKFCIGLFCDGTCGKIHKWQEPYAQQLVKTEKEIKARDFYSPRDYISFVLETFAFGHVCLPTAQQREIYNRLWLVADDELESAFAAFEQEARNYLLTSIVRTFTLFCENARITCWMDENGFEKPSMSLIPSPYDRSALFASSSPSATSQRLQITDFETWLNKYDLEWLVLDLSSLQWVRVDRKVEDVGILDKWKLVAGQEVSWHTQSSVQQEIDRLIAEQKNAFEKFVRDYRQVMAILSQEPISELSSVLEEKPGGQRTFADMEKEKAKELLRDMPDGIAYVAMRTKGERYIPRLETKKLAFVAQAVFDRLALERRILACDNAIAYTTERTVIDEQFRKRRKGAGSPASPVAVPVVTPLPPLPLLKRRSYVSSSDALPALSFEDDYLLLLYHFHYLTIDQIVRIRQKASSLNYERSKVNDLVTKGLTHGSLKSGRKNEKLVHSGNERTPEH